MLGEILMANRKKRPLVHCIANYVTANDCANLLLASGASPIMADYAGEMEEIDAICAGHVLNMGTPNPIRIEAMKIAGKAANKSGHPIIFDPVGAGCSEYRRDAAAKLLNEVHFQIIRGNADEIHALLTGVKTIRGVDSAAMTCSHAAEELAARTESIVIMTGNTDIITNGRKTGWVRNGHSIMRRITGAGCQLSALTGAFAASNPDNLFKAAIAAVCAMGVCGEIAATRMTDTDGNAACRNHIIDAMYNLTAEQLERSAKYEID